MSVQFDRIALIGIGLIGSSLAYDIRRLGLAREIVVATRSPDTLKRAEELGLGDRYTTSSQDAVKDADLVIVSVPVGASESVAKEISGSLKTGAVVTDVGSTKASVIAQMLPQGQTATVMSIEGSADQVALQAVCHGAITWQHLEDMKRAGARQLLVLPVEKMLA